MGEGLAAHGFQAEAGELVSRLMSAVVTSLKSERTFRRYYHADSGTGSGERNAINGLAPLELFLQALGLHIVSPTRIELRGATHSPGR